MTAILELFKVHASMAAIYDALDGERTQKQVAEVLVIGEATVSRRITVLEEEALIEKVSVGKDGVVWQKKHSVERGLRLSKELKKANLI